MRRFSRSGQNEDESFPARAFLHRVEPALNSADCVERLLERAGVLHDQFGSAVHGEDCRPAGGFEALQMGLGVALKVRQGVNVVHRNHSV